MDAIDEQFAAYRARQEPCGYDYHPGDEHIFRDAWNLATTAYTNDNLVWNLRHEAASARALDGYLMCAAACRIEQLEARVARAESN